MSRPTRGGFEAWLRGGQTVGHTYDMIREVLGRLLIVSILWAVVCFVTVNRYATDREELLGWQALQAAVLRDVGWPLPQTLGVNDPAGRPQQVHVRDVGKLPHVRPFAQEYFRLLRWGLVGFFAGVVVICAGSAVWFTEYGRSKLKTRQLRGQIVAPLSELIGQIDKFNFEMAKRFKRPMHQPARLVGIPYPFDTEHEHTLLVGSPGSGKTRALHQLLDTIRTRGDRAVVYDPELEYIENHYDPDRDIILNPFDARSVGWSPYNDAVELPDFDKLSHSIFKEPKSGDPYWTSVARQLFAWSAYMLRERDPQATLEDLLDLLFGRREQLEALLAGTPAYKHIAGGGGGARIASLESVLVEGVTPLIYLLGGNGQLSIREWVNRPMKRGGFLFLSAPEQHIDSIRPLISFWAEIAVGALLSRHEGYRPTTWMTFDEFPSLGKIDRLAEGPQRLRKYGGAIVLGMQQISQVQDLYGHERARTIIGQCATKLILRAQDPDTAQFLSEALGRRLVRRVDETTSYGAHSIRDGVGLTPREELEPVAFPEDIMMLPKMQGWVRMSNAREGAAFPISPVKFYYGDRKKVAPSLVLREGPDPLRAYFAGVRTPRTGPGSEGLAAPSGDPQVRRDQNLLQVGSTPLRRDPRRMTEAELEAAATAVEEAPEPVGKTSAAVTPPVAAQARPEAAGALVEGEGSAPRHAATERPKTAEDRERDATLEAHRAKAGLGEAGTLSQARDTPQLVDEVRDERTEAERRRQVARAIADHMARDGVVNEPLVAPEQLKKGPALRRELGENRPEDRREHDREQHEYGLEIEPG